MKEAYDAAYEEALKIPGFVKDHPVFCTLVAVGVLLFLAPYVLEALGFGTLEAIGFGVEGPIEGKCFCPPFCDFCLWMRWTSFGEVGKTGKVRVFG